MNSDTWLLSPTAVGYLPVLVLHVAGLGYLCLRGHKSRETWLFCGWFGGMTAMIVSQFLAATIHSPLGAYVEWWGGMISVTLALVSWLQFSYHFPRLCYPREARVVLVISVAVSVLILGVMVRETVLQPPQPLSPSITAATDLDTRGTLAVYSFERSTWGFIHTGDARFGASFHLFDLWQGLANLWVLIVWLRETVHLTFAERRGGWVKAAISALRRPVGRDALVARAWVLLVLLAPLPILTSVLEPTGSVPPGTFAVAYSLVLVAIFTTYVGYAREQTTLCCR